MAPPDDPGARDGDTPDGLPDLPPGWGPLVVPDDASALADEAALVRRKLQEQARQGRPPRLPAPRDSYPHRPELLPSARVPLLVIVLTVLSAAAGIFAISGGRLPGPATRPPVTPVSASGPLAGRTLLPALELTGERQEPVSLRGLTPAVILLLDDCTCTDQVGAVAAAAPAGVTVVTVVGAGPVPAPTVTGVRSLGDPTGALWTFLALTPRPGTATTLIVNRSGRVVRVLPGDAPVEEYRAELERLG